MVFSLFPIIAPISAEVRPFSTSRATSSSLRVRRAFESARFTRRARSTSTLVTLSRICRSASVVNGFSSRYDAPAFNAALTRCVSAKAVTSTTGARTSCLRSAGMRSIPDIFPSPRTTSATTAST